jgi:uncharacterized membrane protein
MNHKTHTVFTMTFFRLFSKSLLSLCLFATIVQSQQSYFNPRDQQFKFLGLKRAQSEFRNQKENWERQKTLYQKGLLSRQEYEASQIIYQNAEVSYQQALLDVIFEAPHITIDKATKYQTADGKKRVRLTLRSTAGGSFDFEKLEMFTKQDFEGLNVDEVNNVYVSLLNEQQSIISQPYEAKIEKMKFGNQVTVDFLLLQDLDNVIVSASYANKTETKKIYLEKDERANRVIMASEQFSQEADLGSRATYDMTLELFSKEDNIYKLEVFNLPLQITYEFVETQSSARLSQVKFSEQINNRKLSLVVYLPDRSDTQVVIDKPMTFFAIAIPRNKAEEFITKRGKHYAEKDLVAENVGYVKLELVPRGVGKIQVRATNFYNEIKPGETVTTDLTIYNDGTRRLDNIKVRADAPLNWKSEVTPNLISALMPGKEAQVTVTLKPPSDVSVGDYETTLKTESIANNRRVESEDKKIRVHVAATTNILGTAVLILLLVGILVGVVIFGIKLSRR